MNRIPSELAPGDLIPESDLHQFLRQCGSAPRVFHGCRLVPGDRISLGDHVQIDEAVRIYAGEGVQIGSYVHFAFESSISGGGTCAVGDFASIGVGVRIITGTDLAAGGLTNPTVPPELRAVRRDRVVIGHHALVFTNSIILPGVEIGEGAVVSAGSIVHHNLKPWAIYAGTPLVQVGVRDSSETLAKAAQLKQKASTT